MNKKYITIIVILLFMFNLTGCGSIGYRRKCFCPMPACVYPGVKCDMESVTRSYGDFDVIPITYIGRFIMALDIPFSLIVDTICLPYDFLQVRKEKKKRAKKDNIKREIESSVATEKILKQP